MRLRAAFAVTVPRDAVVSYNIIVIIVSFFLVCVCVCVCVAGSPHIHVCVPLVVCWVFLIMKGGCHIEQNEQDEQISFPTTWNQTCAHATRSIAMEQSCNRLPLLKASRGVIYPLPRATSMAFRCL